MIAIVKNAAPRSHFKRALLLFGRALRVLPMLHDLQPEKPARNGAGPYEKEEADDPEAGPPEWYGPNGLRAAADVLNGCRHLSFQLLASSL